jgi:hypothetical protein
MILSCHGICCSFALYAASLNLATRCLGVSPGVGFVNSTFVALDASFECAIGPVEVKSVGMGLALDRIVGDVNSRLVNRIVMI